MKSILKKGFTLVEMIAIIAILGVIAVIVLPQISSNTQNKKEKQYDNIVNTIENSAKAYFSINPDEDIVLLSTLISEDYLSSGLVNPITETNFTGCVIHTVDENLVSNYEYEDDSIICMN